MSLKKIDNIDEYDIEVQEYQCPNCGAIEILYPCAEEDRKDYAYYSENVRSMLFSIFENASTRRKLITSAIR